MALRALQPFTLPLTVDGTRVEIAGLHRDGTGDPLVFLHGFGSTKEDYADVVFQPELANRPVLAYDAPGCGASQCSYLSALSIPFLVSVATEVLGTQDITRCHLVGHSMGGLTALILADQNPSLVASFVNIEGNVAPEDCFLSRQIASHPHDDPEQFLALFAERVGASRYYASSLYAATLPHRVRAGAVRPIFESIVELSDGGDLLQRFVGLSAPKLFMYGCQNDSLSYLEHLRRNGVELAEIANCAHFPMYSNAPRMWRHIADFITAVD
jgi:pimeloyl-ACP methyl ester carboxylesterase